MQSLTWQRRESNLFQEATVLQKAQDISIFDSYSSQPFKLCPADALRDGAHRLLGPFSCLTEESGSPLLRPPHPMEDADTTPPSTSQPSTPQTLPLKVIACLLPHKHCPSR